MLKKELPISSKPLISSECWTYYKFAVTQDKNHFNFWLANHMRLSLLDNGSAVFGENAMAYPLSYFSDILNIEEADILYVKPIQITNFIIEQINNNKYVLLDLNYKKIIKQDSSGFRLHETLVYGYDCETKEFLTPVLTKGNFKPKRISFETLISAYTDARNYYYQDNIRKFNRRRWFYGITIITPKTVYKNTNAYFDFICRLNWEMCDNIYTRCSYAESDNRSYLCKYYTGGSCLLHMSTLIEHLLIDEIKLDDLRRYTKSCLKIYENHNIILRLMKWFISDIDETNKLLISSCSEYERCCETMYNNIMLLYKCQMVSNINTLLLIKDELKSLYSVEKIVINNFIREATKSYTTFLNNCKEMH